MLENRNGILGEKTEIENLLNINCAIACVLENRNELEEKG